MKPLIHRLALSLALSLAPLLAACGGGGGGGGGAAAGDPMAAPELVGSWQYLTGSLYGADETYARWSDDGTFAIYELADPALLLVDDSEGTFTRPDASTVLMQRDSLPQDTIGVSFADPDLVVLTNGAFAATLRRVDQIPAGAMPREAPRVANEYTIATVDPAVGLAFGSGQLWFSELGPAPQALYPVDPDTGNLGTPKVMSGAPMASQAASFWATAQGGALEISLRTPTNAAPDFVWLELRPNFDHGTELLIIDGAARDAAANILYLYGVNVDLVTSGIAAFDATTYEFLWEADFIPGLVAISTAGDHLWGLARDGRIFMVDPVSLQVERTYEPLADGVAWKGLVAIAGAGSARFFALAESRGGAVLLESEPVLTGLSLPIGSHP